MTDIGLRDLGSFVPGRRIREARAEPSVSSPNVVAPDVLPPRVTPPPAAPTHVAPPHVASAGASALNAPPPLPADPPLSNPGRLEPQVAEPQVLVTPPPPRPQPQPPKPQPSVFAGDRPGGHDLLGIDETLLHLAELALHKGTAGPLSIGLIGGAGSGKSFAMARLTARIGELAAAASKVNGPFRSQVHVETIDAASLDGAPDLALAARLHGGLQRPYPELANEIGAASRDPHAALRAAEEKLDEARRRLDAERRALDEAGSRRARLTETVLYESAGSQIDAYARSNRAGIESRLVAFGILGDPIRNYKDLVQLVTGPGSIAGLAVRSLFAFKGQLKLLVTAALLVAVGFALGIAIDDKVAWLASMRGGPQAGASLADWLQAHIDLLAAAKTGAYLLALVAVVANLVRAVAFLRPVLKGARLLEADLDTRRRGLDGLCAHQTKRVDALERAVDRFGREVAEAERRVGGAQGMRYEPSPFEQAGGPARAQNVFAALATALADDKAKAPQRIVLALDNLDAASPERARAILDALHRAAVPGLVTVVAADIARLDPDGTRRDEIERWIQVPLRLDAAASTQTRLAILNNALGHGEPPPAPARLDASRSSFDAVVSEEEAALLVALSEIAGRTPRALKRFANLYRLARLGDERLLGPLAFMLAVALGGSEAEQAACRQAAGGDAGSRFDLAGASMRLQDALNATMTLAGRFTKGEALEAMRRARSFTVAGATRELAA